MTTKINDLRSALDYLRTIPGQLVETNVEARSTCRDLRYLPLCWCQRHR